LSSFRGVPLLAFALLATAGQIPHGRIAAPSDRTSVVSIGRDANARPIPAGFLGLSMEISSVESYAGTDPGHIDPVLEQ